MATPFPAIFVGILTTLVVFAGWTAPADAHQPRSTSRTTTIHTTTTTTTSSGSSSRSTSRQSHRFMDVEFEDLYVTTRGDRVTVEYEIHWRDWRRMQRDGITPYMELYVPARRHQGYRYHDSHRLRHRTGTVTFYGVQLPARARYVQVDLTTVQRGSRGYSERHYYYERTPVSIGRERHTHDRRSAPPPRRQSSITIRVNL